MHRPQACPRWLLTGLLLLGGLALTRGALEAQSTPEKTFTNNMGMEFVGDRKHPCNRWLRPAG